jgi:hypothetical protein
MALMPCSSAFSPEAARRSSADSWWPVRGSGPASQRCLVGSPERTDPGVIDPDYSGPEDEIMIPVLNFTASEVQIRRGDRVAQGVVLPAPRVTWNEVSHIRQVTRGGFGATG